MENYFVVNDRFIYRDRDQKVLIKYIGNEGCCDIPEGTEIIEQAAFASCYSLKTVTVPKSLKEIRNLAFFNCINLDINLDEYLCETVANDAFLGCAAAKKTTYVLKGMTISEIEKSPINAEKNEYFNGEIYFAFTLSGITLADDIHSCNATNFKENWKLIEDIFNTAKDDNVLMHRVLLTFGDYSKTFSSYDDNTNYLITYYCYNEKHHKQDWRGMLRGDKFNIFSSMFDDFKRKKRSNQKFSEYARDRISDYLNSSPAYSINTVEELNYYLVKNEELFKYMVSSFRCWYQDGDYRLLKTSKRSTYVNFKLYHIATGSGLSDIKMNDGSGHKHSDYISYNGHEYQYKDNTFCERMTDAIAAHTVDEMINFLRQP